VLYCEFCDRYFGDEAMLEAGSPCPLCGTLLIGASPPPSPLRRQSEDFDEDLPALEDPAPQEDASRKRRDRPAAAEDPAPAEEAPSQEAPDSGAPAAEEDQSRKRPTMQVAGQLGQEGNHLRLKEGNFRFAFWNYENLSGVLAPGRSGRPESLDSARNQVRLAVLTQTVAVLDLDAIALMELGSDGEQVLGMLAGLLGQATRDTWDATMSELTGRVITPQAELQTTFNAFANWGAAVYHLEAVLPYYTLAAIDIGRRYASRHLEAQLSIARRSDRPGPPAVLASLEALRGNEPSHEDIEGALQPFLLAHDMEEVGDHRQVADLFHGTGETWQRTLDQLIANERWPMVALFLVLSGSTVRLRWNGRPMTTDGPRLGLRCLGGDPGRYERYGILFRTGLRESYILNELVMTELMREGAPTNSRAAMSFQMPLGNDHFLPAYLIHSMYTPAPTDTHLNAAQVRALRVATLVAQARHGARRPNPPMFILGDTNIHVNDFPAADGQMRELGYERLGAGLRTTLRQEGTLRSAFTRTGDYYCQPYDAVYQHTMGRGRFPTEVLYPGHENPMLQEIFLRLLSRNQAVRAWYFGMLRNRYTAIYRLSQGRRHEDLYSNVVQGAIEGAGTARPSASLLPARLSPATAEGQNFFIRLFASLGGVSEALGIDESAVRARSQEDDDEDEVEDAQDRDDPREQNAQLSDHVRAYLALRPGLERAYALFHRHFASDHRMVMLVIRYDSWLPYQRTRRSTGADSFAATSARSEGYRVGAASGAGSSCFLSTLLQLANGNEAEDEQAIAALRLSMAMDGVIPLGGFLDANDPQLQAWVAANYPALTVHVWSLNTVTGALAERTSMGAGPTQVHMLLDGGHFVPLRR